MRQNVDKKKKEKSEQSFVVSWENFSYQVILFRNPITCKCWFWSAEATVKQKTSKCTNYRKLIFFQLLFLVGFCSVSFKWARNRDVAGIKVNQARRHKSNIVFMDQGTCISFSKRYIFTIPFLIPQYIVHLLLPNRLFSLHPFELLLLSTFRFQAWPYLFNWITILFQVILVKSWNCSFYFYFLKLMSYDFSWVEIVLISAS